MSTPKDINTSSPFLTTADLAARWKVTPMTLRRWRKDGKLKASFLGRGVRFAMCEVERIELEAQA
jgi:excisionase family DNA binding protein